MSGLHQQTRERRAVRLTALLAAGILAGCGGGGSSAPVAPAAGGTSTGAQSARATLTIAFPQNYHTAIRPARGTAAKSRATTARRKPAYVNPNAGNTLTITEYGNTVAQVGISAASGSQTVTFPLLSGSYGSGTFAVSETDGNGDVLAYGTNTGTVTANAGSAAPSFAITMAMVVAQIAITSDAIAGRDAQIAVGQSFCLSAAGNEVYAFAADASGGFVTPGTIGGNAGTDPNGYPSIPVPTVNAQQPTGFNGTAAAGTAALQASPLGFVLSTDAAFDGASTTFSVSNPSAFNGFGPNPVTGTVGIFPKSNPYCNPVMVLDYGTGTVDSFPGGSSATSTPFAQGDTGAYGTVDGAATDAYGNFYTASETDAAIEVYGTPYTNPFPSVIRTISGSQTLLSTPSSVAIDHTGNLYVANGGSSTITVYAPGANGNAAPLRTIQGPAVTGGQIAVDASGYLYQVNSGNGQVEVYSPGASGTAVAPALTYTGLSAPVAIAVDANGYVYVADGSITGVYVFTPRTSGTTTPVLTLQNIVNGVADGGLAVDPAGHLFVTDPSSATIAIFAPVAGQTGTQTPTPIHSITGLSSPRSLALW